MFQTNCFAGIKKQPTFETTTNGRLLNETRLFINNSSTKWISIGVVPSAKIIEEPGFKVDVQIGGDKMKPMSLGGLDGYLTLIHNLSEIPELEYIAGTLSETIPKPSKDLFKITQSMIGKTACLVIADGAENKAYLALPTIEELFERHLLIHSTITKLNLSLNDIENEFNALIREGMPAIITKATTIAAPCMLCLQLLSNFKEFIGICIAFTNNKDSVDFASASAENDEASFKQAAAAAAEKKKKKK